MISMKNYSFDILNNVWMLGKYYFVPLFILGAFLRSVNSKKMKMFKCLPNIFKSIFYIKMTQLPSTKENFFIAID